MPDRTCNSSACAMAAKYLGANIGLTDQYLRRVLQYGDTTDHSAQTSALNDYGIKSSFHYNLDFKDLERLGQGKPVVIGINHRGPLHAPTGGHMITVIGKQGNDYIVHDPYGSLHDGYTGRSRKWQSPLVIVGLNSKLAGRSMDPDRRGCIFQ